MKFKNNRKLLKLFGISSVVLGVSLPLASCSYYEPWNKDNNVDKENDNNNEDTNNGSTGYIGSIDSEIVNSKTISKTDKALVEKNANEYGLTQNSNDFAENGDFSTIDGDSTKLEEDIIGFLNVLYFSNDKEISITNSNVSDIKITNDSSTSKNADSSSSNSILKLNSSKISFTLTATISNGNSSTKIKFPWGETTISPNSVQTLKISVSNQTMLPTINEMSGTYYLGWKVKSASVIFKNVTTTVTDLDFTLDSFSKVFYVAYNNLSNVNSYFDLQKKYSSSLSKNLTDSNFKEQFESSIDNQQEDYFFYADMLNSLVSLINKNLPIDQMLRTASKYLVEIFTHIGVIPSEFESLLIEALYGKSDGTTIVNEPLINVLYNNRQTIFSLLKHYLGSAYDVIEPIISGLKPGMVETDKAYQLIKTYVDMLLKTVSNEDDKTTLSEIIYGDILGVQGKTAKSLWDIILTRYEFIIKFAQSKISSFSDLGTKVLNLLKTIIKTSENNSYSSIVDAIFSSTDSKKSFMDAVTALIPGISDQVKNYLTILVVDNANFDKTHVMAMINSFSTFFENLFTYKDGATSETKYNERYANLVFKHKWNTLSLNSDNLTVSYSYQLSISLNKEISLNLKTIKDLISKDSFDTLLKQIIKGTISDSLSDVAISVLSNLQGDLFNFIPDTISFGKGGVDNSNLIYTYTGTNEKIWFNPMIKNSNYYNGFSVGYNVNIFYYDPSMWNSITNNYKQGDFERDLSFIIKVGTSTFKYYDFWKPILENVIMRSYNISGRISASDYSEKIATTLTYNPNYYYTNLTFTNTSSSLQTSELNNMFSTNNSKNYLTQPNDVTWSGNTTETINGKTLIATEENKKNVLGKMYKINDSNNSSYTNLGYGYDFEFDPILNFSTSLQFIIDINVSFLNVKANVNYKIDLGASVYTSTIYFPINFYDTTNKKLVSSVSKNYTYFNVNAKQVS